MPRRSHPIVPLAGALTAGVVLMGLVAPAESAPRGSDDKSAVYAERILRLEAEVQNLKGELRACQDRKTRSHAMASPARPVASPPHKPTAEHAADACSRPFTVSRDGVKKPKSECLESQATCEPPYHFVNDIKTYRLECL